MRRPAEVPAGSSLVADILDGSGEPVAGMSGNAHRSVRSLRPDGGDPEPPTVLARSVSSASASASASRRVPVAVIAGAEWVRLMERL